MAAELYRFADFELDHRAYRLSRGGTAVHLQPIPFQLLCLLVERHGQLVTRGEILDLIWGKGVFIDSENSINTAVRKIRQALNDDTDEPPFCRDRARQGLPLRRADSRGGPHSSGNRGKPRLGS